MLKNENKIPRQKFFFVEWTHDGENKHTKWWCVWVLKHKNGEEEEKEGEEIK